jgi:hypothetical protein
MQCAYNEPQARFSRLPLTGVKLMSKSQDSKKAVKKEPAKTPKEKQAAKKLKKEAAKRQ